jgi:hypothetical protein
MVSAQHFCAFGQRVRKGHPEGGNNGLGISPSSLIRFLLALRSGFAMGIAESSIWV